MKIILIPLFALLLAGCEERYRYPCQDPHNWSEEFCKKPFCSGNGTCPEDLAHYLKENVPGQPTFFQRDTRGPCK
jgi:hypothetical protein